MVAVRRCHALQYQQALRQKKRTPRPAQVSFDRQKMARLEVRIKEATLAIQLKAIARAGAPRTSAKSQEKKNTPTSSSNSKSKPKSEEKVDRQMTVAKLNNLCNTFCKEELSNEK